MGIVVQKFGGTSVADATRIKRAAARAVDAHRAGQQVVMVVSARGKKTDELVSLAAEITDRPRPREMDMLLATGEQESVALVAMAVHELGVDAISLTGAQIGVRTDSAHTRARIVEISTERMKAALAEGKIVIAAGFQGIDEGFNITTLGRGGSDTTATALAAVLRADECQIYTDVEGVYTTDPRRVAEARHVTRLSYDEMLELASVGAGVMHSRSIEFAKKYRVPLRVRPSYSDGTGTLIAPEPEEDPPVVTGVALVSHEVRVTLLDVPDEPGTMNTIFGRMAARKIPVDMVVQDVGQGGLAEVSFTVPEDDLAETLTAAEDAVAQLGAGRVSHGTNVAKVSVVGAGMRKHTGVAAQMFQSLADAGISIGMITTSEIKISVLVDRDDCERALAVVHAGFKLEEPRAAAPEIGWTASPPANDDGNGDASEELQRDVVDRLASMEDIVVSEVQLDTTQSRVSLAGLVDEPGVAAKIFGAVAEGGVMVDMIVQNVGHDGRTNISFTIPREDLETCLLLVREVFESWPQARLGYDEHIAKLSVMGIGLRSHTGVGEKMFAALAGAGVNVQLVNTSEIRISVVVGTDEAEPARKALLEGFGLD